MLHPASDLGDIRELAGPGMKTLPTLRLFQPLRDPVQVLPVGDWAR